MSRARRFLPLAAFAALMGATVLLPAQETQDSVDKIFDRIEESRGATLWEGIRELDALGRGALEAVRKGATRADGHVRVAAAKILYANDLREEALDILSKVVGGKNAAAKKAAADMAASLVAADKTLEAQDKKRFADDLCKQAGQSDDPLAQIALWRAVWHLTRGMEPVRKVRKFTESSERRDVREEAALSLAEMDRFVSAKEILQTLAQEPSDRGRMARCYLEVNNRDDYIQRQLGDQARSGPKYDFKLLEETLDILKSSYHDESKVVAEKIIEAAARGACASLDPYTTYMDEAMIHQLKEEDLAGQYGGIGARVSMRKDKAGNSWLTIEEPIFSGPAYRTGLRSGDTIVDIGGEHTRNRELADLVRRLRGPPGTKAAFKVMRRGWPKEREYEIAREQIQLETTTHRLLPGNIGYIRLSTFGEKDTDRVAEALKDLDGMKALVFDLRGNSGGYLKTAHRIAGYFLDKDQMVVSTRGHGVELETRRAEGDKLTDAPLVVLVDDASASASEILAGALQDHKRAFLVGEKTFGKGSVQEMKLLKSKDNKCAVKVTISKWYLPSGRSVEKDKAGEGGIEPDLKAAPPERDYWKDAEFERFRAGDELDRYIKKNYEEKRDLFRKLAESDGEDPSRYPGFDDLYASLQTKASKDEVRQLLRELIRKRVQDDLGKPFYLDFQSDTVLQRGLLEACRLAKIDAKGIPEYGTFASNPPAKPEPEAK